MEMKIDCLNNVKTPCYVISISKIEENLRILKKIKDQTGCSILLSQRDFCMFSIYPMVFEVVDGAMSGGLGEAHLGKDEMIKENHIFAPAYIEDEFEKIADTCDHIIFNSIDQMNKFYPLAKIKNRQIGLRINVEIYSPKYVDSWMGTQDKEIDDETINKINGIYFYNLADKTPEEFKETLDYVEENYGRQLSNLQWVNFGGAQNITKDGKDLDLLISQINDFKAKYGVKVYVEAGIAISNDAVSLVGEVLDIVNNGRRIAILSVSSICHMPQALVLSVKPIIYGAGQEGEKVYSYRVVGNTSAEVDIMGYYSFDKPLMIKDKIVFTNIPINTTVLNNSYNGLTLPSIYVLEENGELTQIREFSYRDYKTKLS